MGDIRKLVTDIDRGVNMRKNLPIYGRMVAENNVNYAAIELTFSITILCGLVQDTHNISEQEHALFQEVIALLDQVLEENKEQSRPLAECAGAIRKRITAVMDVYTSYVDRLICYNEALNRMSLRFSPDREKLDEVNAIQEDSFIDRVLRFLAGHKDRSIVKERLQMVMGCVPVHMTKGKLMERISQTVSLYKGGDQRALDTFVYMIRSVAMLHRPDESIISGKKAGEYLSRLEQTDFSTLDEETYMALKGEMEQISDYVYWITDFYQQLQKVVNNIYALCLARLYAEKESDEYRDCMAILRDVVNGTFVEESLEKLEGKIEDYVERAGYLEAVLTQTSISSRDLIEELGLRVQFQDYALISDLLSDSLFIDLDQGDENAIVDDGAAKKAAEELVAELSEQLSKLPRAVKRVVMSLILENIPADFRNMSEVENYIRTNLFGCQDLSEKGVALMEISKIMREEEWSDRNDFLV